MSENSSLIPKECNSEYYADLMTRRSTYTPLALKYNGDRGQSQDKREEQISSDVETMRKLTDSKTHPWSCSYIITESQPHDAIFMANWRLGSEKQLLDHVSLPMFENLQTLHLHADTVELFRMAFDSLQNMHPQTLVVTVSDTSPEDPYRLLSGGMLVRERTSNFHLSVPCPDAPSVKPSTSIWADHIVMGLSTRARKLCRGKKHIPAGAKLTPIYYDAEKDDPIVKNTLNIRLPLSFPSLSTVVHGSREEKGVQTRLSEEEDLPIDFLADFTLVAGEDDKSRGFHFQGRHVSGEAPTWSVTEVTCKDFAT